MTMLAVSCPTVPKILTKLGPERAQSHNERNFMRPIQSAVFNVDVHVWHARETKAALIDALPQVPAI